MKGGKQPSGSGVGPHTASEGMGNASGAVEDQLSRDLAVVVQALAEFLDWDVILDWLLTEQYMLAGRTPIQALRDSELAEVLAVVNATEHGAYL